MISSHDALFLDLLRPRHSVAMVSQLRALESVASSVAGDCDLLLVGDAILEATLGDQLVCENSIEDLDALCGGHVGEVFVQEADGEAHERVFVPVDA